MELNLKNGGVVLQDPTNINQMLGSMNNESERLRLGSCDRKAMGFGGLPACY